MGRGRVGAGGAGGHAGERGGAALEPLDACGLAGAVEAGQLRGVAAAAGGGVPGEGVGLDAILDDGGRAVGADAQVDGDGGGQGEDGRA